MEIKFTHTPNDLDFNATAEIVVKRQRPLTLATAGIFLILIFALWHFASSDNTPLHILLFCAGAIFMQLILLLAYKASVIKTLKSTPGYGDSNTYVISPDGIHIDCSCCTGDLKWSHFQSFAETNDHFFLMKGKNPCNNLPKRAIPPADQESLRALLKEKLPAK